MKKTSRFFHSYRRDIPSPFSESSIDVALLCALKTGKSLEEVMNSLKLEFETRHFENLPETVKEIVQSARGISESYIPFRITRDFFKKYALNRLGMKGFPNDESFHLRFWIAIHSNTLNEFKESLKKIEEMLNEEWLMTWKWQKRVEDEISRFWNYANSFRNMKDENWDRITYLGNASRPFIRFMESLAAALAVFILLPFYAVIGVIIFFAMGRPVFFVQKRVGRFGKTFPLIKFRTMYTKKQYGERKKSDHWPTETSADDERVTPIGQILRKFKLDEMPQLLNIALGHMELVGYRPELPEKVAVAETDYAILCQQRPGITDPASLAFIDENELLMELKKIHGDKAYDEVILPIKTSISMSYLLQRVRSGRDSNVIFRTVYESFFPRNEARKNGLPGKETLPHTSLSFYERTGCDIWVDVVRDQYCTYNIDYGEWSWGEAMPVVIFGSGEEKSFGMRFFNRRGRQAVTISFSNNENENGKTLIRYGLLPDQREEFRILYNANEGKYIIEKNSLAESQVENLKSSGKD